MAPAIHRIDNAGADRKSGPIVWPHGQARDELLVGDAVRAVGLGAERARGGAPRRPRSCPRTSATCESPSKASTWVAIAVEEPAIVGDDHRAAGEREQRLLERAQRVDVEVVGRLVEQQQVAAACAAASPGAARLRSPPESLPTLRCWSEPLKLKPRDVGARVHLAVADLDLRRRRRRSPPRRSSRRRARRATGRRRRARRVSPTRSAPRVGLLLADDHPEQRRLAGAVGADHADDPGRRQREREVLDQQPVAEALAQALGLDHDVAEARPGRDVDLDLVELDVALLGEQRLVAVRGAPSTSCAGPSGSRAPTRARRAIVRCAGLVGALLLREALLLLLEPGGVVALERDARGRGRARGSSRRRCRGSSDRG